MLSSASATSQRRARLALVAVAASWGLTFVLTKFALRQMLPASFVFVRFTLASIALVPWVPRPWRPQAPLLLAGILLGCINVGVHLLQAHSMVTIGAARAAFLAGSHLLFVPILESACGLGTLGKVDLAAIALCIAGLYLLTGCDLSQVSTGDLLAVTAEMFFAAYMIVAALAGRRRMEVRLFTLAQMATTAVLSAVLAWPERDGWRAWSSATWLTVAVAALGCTLAPIWAQMHFQPRLRPSHAALIISLEPLFAGALAFVLLDELLSPAMLAGAALMLVAAFLPAAAAR